MSDKFSDGYFSNGGEWIFYQEYLLPLVWLNILGFDESIEIKIAENYKRDVLYIASISSIHYLEIKKK